MNESLRAQARAARDAVRAGRFDGASLLAALRGVPFVERDAWVDELLDLDAAPDDIVLLPRGAVPYVPCGVDAILHTIEDAPVRASDVFVDLGAGLGRVAMLVHLLTGARAVGVELQAPLVERARVAAQGLALRDAAFVPGDAATTPVDDGTVFFIYASFSAPVLRDVLTWLRRVAARRRITLCAVGFDVVDQPWLIARPSRSPELVLYDSLSAR